MSTNLQFSQYNVYQQLTSCRVASTVNIAGSYFNGISNNGVEATLTVTALGVLIIDGVTINMNDRVLLVGQTNANENGIYIATSIGSGSSQPILQRSADMQNIEQLLTGQFIPVGAGDTEAGTIYVVCEPIPGHFGIDPIVLSPSAAGSSVVEAGGSPTFVITDPNVTANSIVVGNFASQTTPASVLTVLPGAGIITVTASADPGASVFNYIVT